MTTLGMPTSMFWVFAATVLAGSLGALHFLVVHVLLGRPFADEKDGLELRDPAERTAAEPDTDPGEGSDV